MRIAFQQMQTWIKINSACNHKQVYKNAIWFILKTIRAYNINKLHWASTKVEYTPCTGTHTVECLHRFQMDGKQLLFLFTARIIDDALCVRAGRHERRSIILNGNLQNMVKLIDCFAQTLNLHIFPSCVLTLTRLLDDTSSNSNGSRCLCGTSFPRLWKKEFQKRRMDARPIQIAFVFHHNHHFLCFNR